MSVLPYGQQWLDEVDIAEVMRALRTERITQGPLIEAFEERVAAYCGARFAIAMSSGTAALHAACFAAGIGSSDEVITSPLTFVATASAVVYQGGKPVFADIDPRTFNIDPEAIAARVTDKTRAILPVHFGGLPCEMERIRAIAERHSLTIIEDACHALGAEWQTTPGRWERVGSCRNSEMAVFSFHPVKHVTTGEGGIVLTNREDLRYRLKLFRHHGLVKAGDPGDNVKEPWRSEMTCLGFNYRITDFQCAMGLSQMDKLDRFLSRRRQIAATYQRAFSDLELVTQPEDPQRVRHAWHLYVVQLPLERLGMNRRAIFEACRAQGLGVNVHYLPVHLHPFYRSRFSYRPGDYPLAERYYERTITLPLFPRMTDGDVETVIRIVRRVVESPQSATPAGAISGDNTSNIAR